jgi:hypothetical protein
MRHDFKLTPKQPDGPLAASATKVSQEMESIFGVVPWRPAEATPDPVVPITQADRAEPRSWFWVVALVAMAGLLTVGGATWMALQREATPHMAPKAAAPAPVAAATAPVAHQPVRRLPQAPAIIAPSTQVKRVAIAPRLKPKAATPRRAPASEGNILDDRFSPRIRASHMYPDIAAADREMREAYARAAYVGLDPKLLRTYRDRWRQVRKKVEPDPAYAIEAYYQLARELDAARRRS